MEYDETLAALNLTNNEKIIVEHLFKGTHGYDLRESQPLMIREQDRIWFDSCSGTGICPKTLVRYLRKEKPTNGFEDNEMFECKYHIERLPHNLNIGEKNDENR